MKISTILLLTIIIISAFLRLYNLTQVPPGLYPDEAMNGNNALEALSTGHFSALGGPASGWKVFYPENNGREGLFINIQAISIKLFGNEPWALRVVSAIFGIFTVLGVYFLTRELFRENSKYQTSNYKQIQNSNDQNSKRFGIRNLGFGISRGEKIALLSAFFLATSFWHINFSRIGFRAIMAPFFLTWALYFLLLALNKAKELPAELGSINRTKRKYVLYSILGGIFLGLGFHSYIAFRAMPAVIIIVWLLYWFKNREKAFRKKIIISGVCFTVVSLIMFAPLGIYFLKNPADFFGRTTQVSIMNSSAPLKDLGINILKTAGMFNFFGDWNWRHNYAGKPELFWPVGTLFLIGVFLGIKSIFRTSDVQKFAFWILFFWLIIAALPVVVSSEGIPHALRSIIMIPAVFILAGFGGIYLYEFIKSSISRTSDVPRGSTSQMLTPIREEVEPHKIEIKNLTLYALCFIILAIIAIQGYKSYFIDWGKNPNVQGAFAADYAQIGYELRDLPRELPKYVIVEANGVDVRGIPMPTQTVMFLTDTFTPEKQAAKNIHYILPGQESQIPAGAYVTYIK